MYKFIAFFILLLSFLHHGSTFSCIHDEVTLIKFPKVFSRSTKFQDIRSQRMHDPSLFEPLEIHFYVDNVDPAISTTTIFNIDQALRKIRTFLSSTFRVRKRKHPFRIERKSCTQRWESGKNRGKCSEFKSDTEICEIKDISYTIPKRFLAGLHVYNFEGDKPRQSVPDGPGILDSNMIIFITGLSTGACEGQDVFAYGTYCRLNTKTNEPLVGIINLCPSYFNKKVYPFDHYYNILLHETFHILGFSFNLIEKFLPCEKGYECNIPKNIIQEDEYGVGRMLFPKVITAMQEHFACSKSDFGGPMAIVSDEVANTTDPAVAGKYSSHWHPLLMYGSIMTPNFTEFEEIMVDNMTLAVLASTGWYQVNYSNSDQYTFGEKQGCGFGFNGSCSDSKYLCDPAAKTSGCDMFHKTIGFCSSLVSYHSCGVFVPYSKEDCESQAEKEYSLDFYALDYKRKCFMAGPSDKVWTPSCLPIKCTSPSTYSVLVNVTWYPCQHIESIMVENRVLGCADSSLFCSDASVPIAQYSCSENYFFAISVRMFFKEPSLNTLVEYHNFKNFKLATIRGVAKIIDIPVNYIINSSLTAFRKVYLDFSICPPASLSSTDIVKLVGRVQEFLNTGHFRQILKGPDDMIISSEKIQINPVDVLAFSDYEGFKILLTIPFVFGIFLIATVAASLVRLYFNMKHKPRRYDGQNKEDASKTSQDA